MQTRTQSYGLPMQLDRKSVEVDGARVEGA